MASLHNPSGSLSSAAAGFSACGTLADKGLEAESRDHARLPSRHTPIAVQPGRAHPSQLNGVNRTDDSRHLGSAFDISTQSGNLLPSSFWEKDYKGNLAGDLISKELSVVQLDLPHVRQHYSWDCGVACVRMVLSYLGNPRSSQELIDLLGTRSVWTIDLAVLLRRVGGPQLRFLFCTAALGAEDSHSELDMYRSDFDKDERRVNDLFRSAPALGVAYAQVTLEARDLVRLLVTGRVLLLVLLDVRLVRNRHAQLLASVMMAPGSSRYTGHYVVVCGYDPNSRQYTYLDPAQAPALFAIDADDLDSARTSVGTDEDVIVIEVPETPADQSQYGESSSSSSGCVGRRGYSRYGSASPPASQPASVLAAAARLKDQAVGAKDQFWRSADQAWSSLFVGDSGGPPGDGAGCGGNGSGCGLKDL
mmetsp:Transcript_82297/g.160583  ORF Transcript_82297/g.160583 Transcript_82297/m.160583 type:complete len:420 (-) Transcript_82297:206-1465(-)